MKWEIMGRMGILGKWEHWRQGNAFMQRYRGFTEALLGIF